MARAVVTAADLHRRIAERSARVGISLNARRGGFNGARILALGATHDLAPPADRVVAL
jgi:hypothetical protein